MEDNSINNNVNQEIDVWEILQKFGLWFAGILRKLFIFLLRKSIKIACFTLVGVAIGEILYISSEPYYSTYMLVKANVASNFFYVTLLNENLAAGNTKASENLVQKLGISESTARQIKSIRAYYCVDLNKDGFPDIIDKENVYSASIDSLKAAKILPDLFYIRVLAYSSDVLPYIQHNILNFINKNDYVQRHNARRIEEINEQISYLHQQQSRFDSLQQFEYFRKESTKKTSGNGQLIVLNEQAQPLYHDQLIELNNQIMEKNTKLQLYADPITIVQDFAETFYRENSAMFYIKPLGIASFLVGLVFFICWDYRKQLKRLCHKKGLQR
jgi:hypothetical protein